MLNKPHSLYGVALNSSTAISQDTGSTNSANPEDQFRDFVFDTLGVCLDVIDHGKLQRFSIDGKLTGAYIFHPDGNCPAGYCQDFKQGIKANWKFTGPRKTYTDSERQVYKLRMVKEQKQRQKEIALLQSQTATRAQSNWSQSIPALPDHPYLARKKVLAHNARLYNGSLVIPIYDQYKQLVNLQSINPDGIKRFLKHGKLQGCFSVIGKASDDVTPIDLTEGYATGCSVHERHGCQTFIAFSANNLEPVARVLRDLFPMRRLYIYGDNDINGVGQEAAHKAAISSKGVAVRPDIPGTDWNDIYSNNDTKEVPV
jgi:putative DNA primase/helicase